MKLALSFQEKNGDMMLRNDVHNNAPSHIELVDHVLALSDGHISPEQAHQIVQRALQEGYEGITQQELAQALVLAAANYIEDDPIYDTMAARLLLAQLSQQVIGVSPYASDYEALYRQQFITSIQTGYRAGHYDPRMMLFDLSSLAQQLVIERDHLFEFRGLQTLSSRYHTTLEGKLLELPQITWMRIAMGFALEEDDMNARAVEFYHLISSLKYLPSTPSLLHAGLLRAQLSSCFLGTVEDDLKSIFKVFGDIAELSKWSGGVAYDWTPLRATGAMINTIKVESQGLIPFLKIANDVTAAINRSGRRRSATVAYLECWHYDFEDFCDMRRNTGDERRRAHDINFAAWVPDLFMQRVEQDQEWTLFSPDEVPDLHEIYGKKFAERYVYYEGLVEKGKIRLYKKIRAVELWRRMLTRLFETGFPWITFKDPCNVRSPQDHVGVVHSSNLCTEITLNSSVTETAVCNLGSINIARHLTNEGSIDYAAMRQSIHTAIRMLDNVIELNFYPTIEARNANLRHRAIGLGMMGYQDALFTLNLPVEAQKTLDITDELTEHFAYYAIEASSALARIRGSYHSFKGSKWDRGIFPLDTMRLLESERGVPVENDRTVRLDWEVLKQQVRQYGMRNSNTMAIAPTATIANIAGCYPCIEPQYSNMYVKSNMAGESTVINKYLIADLQRLGLWNKRMKDLIKFYEGSVQQIPEVPQHLKEKYRGAFEIAPEAQVLLTARRAKWIDQAIAHNIFLPGTSGKRLSDVYMLAWRHGIKTMYYVRTLAASQIEKSTLDAKKFGYTQQRNTNVEMATAEGNEQENLRGRSCGIDNPECESCQ